MTDTESPRLERRVLIAASVRADAQHASAILEQAELACACCTSIAELCDELARGAGAVLLAEESVLGGASARLVEWIARQPPWSDLPVLILAPLGADSSAVAAAMDELGNVTVLERPVRVAALVSAVRTALRSRERQYQARDHIAEREHAGELLRQRVEELHTLLDTLPIGVFIAHDTSCTKITGNRAATHLFRVRPDANLSKSAPTRERPSHFVVYRDGVEVPPHELPVQRAARGEAIREQPLDQVFSDGSVLHTLVSASPLYGRDGRLRGAVGAVLDITELKRAEATLRSADRRKDEFLAILAHELRNPLAPLCSSLQVLRARAASDPTGARLVEMMERQVAHMVRLVDDLLDVARITRGTIELRKERVAIAALLERALETSRPWLDAAGLELAVECPAEPLVVEGDPVRLAQVLANLLNNAAKYTERGGRVALRARRDGADVELAVSDTGIGIEPSMLAHVFEMFTQLDAREGQLPSGLGIGLTLVKNLIELHGGAVHAHSTGSGHGSEFTLRLPLARGAGAHANDARARAPAEVPDGAPDDAPEQHADSRPTGTARAAQRVLVVDDNADAAISLGILLRLLGADTHVVHGGADALAALDAFAPTIVLLDIGMPGLDGYEVARRMRARADGAALKLVALTGWGQPEDRRRTSAAGFDAHLIKPAELTELQALLAGDAPRRDASGPA